MTEERLINELGFEKCQAGGVMLITNNAVIRYTQQNGLLVTGNPPSDTVEQIIAVVNMFSIVKIEDSKKTTKPEIIIRLCCQYFDLTREQMFGDTRQQEYKIPRQITMAMLTMYTKLTLKAIGEICRSPRRERDHATVLHAKNVVSTACCIVNKKVVNPEVCELVSGLKTIIEKHLQSHNN